MTKRIVSLGLDTTRARSSNLGLHLAVTRRISIFRGDNKKDYGVATRTYRTVIWHRSSEITFHDITLRIAYPSPFLANRIKAMITSARAYRVQLAAFIVQLISIPFVAKTPPKRPYGRT
jgi:hypothetical protein